MNITMHKNYIKDKFGHAIKTIPAGDFSGSSYSIAYRVINESADPDLVSDILASGLLEDINEGEKSTILSLIYSKAQIAAEGVLSEIGQDGKLVAKSIEEIYKKNPWLSIFISLLESGANPWLDFSNCQKLMKVQSGSENQSDESDDDNDDLNDDHQLVTNFSSTVFSKMLLPGDSRMLEILMSDKNKPSSDVLDAVQIIDDRRYYYSNGRRVDRGINIIHYLAEQSYYDSIKILHKFGMDINIKDAFGRTPAFYVKDKKTFLALLECGAKVDVIDNAGDSMLSYWDTKQHTGALKAELRKAVIDQMKKTMTDDEIRTAQIPSLLKLVSTGTKTEFESMMRKLKVKPGFIVDLGPGGQRSILTEAIFRRLGERSHESSPKGEIFMSLGLKSWETELMREPWPDMPGYKMADLMLFSGVPLPKSAVGDNTLNDIRETIKTHINDKYLSVKNQTERAKMVVDDVFKTMTLMMQNARSAHAVTITTMVNDAMPMLASTDQEKRSVSNIDVSDFKKIIENINQINVNLKLVDKNYIIEKMIDFMKLQAEIVKDQDHKASSYVFDSIAGYNSNRSYMVVVKKMLFDNLVSAANREGFDSPPSKMVAFQSATLHHYLSNYHVRNKGELHYDCMKIASDFIDNISISDLSWSDQDADSINNFISSFEKSDDENVYDYTDDNEKLVEPLKKLSTKIKLLNVSNSQPATPTSAKKRIM